MTIPIPDTLPACMPTADELERVLLNTSGRETLQARFRALFTLRGLANDEAIDIISRAFGDPSALLKHELAYVLGQMRLPRAIPILAKVLADVKEEAMVRHEAAEALGAIGDPQSIALLRPFLEDETVVVRETCQIAIDLLSSPSPLQPQTDHNNAQGELTFASVDPAPPLKPTLSVTELQTRLMDTSLSLYDRYRAMFSLRNRGTPEAVLALTSGFADGSALFRHEIAYVLGQLQHPLAIPALAAILRNPSELGMVRHECAEALGSIATPECLSILREFEEDQETVVRESCIVARDMYEYENSSELHLYPSGNCQSNQDN